MTERCESVKSATHVPQLVRDAVRSSGMPLPARERTRFGHDFSNVRVHADASAAASARAVSARAYTLGEHVVFGANEYAPNTERGETLLVHELAHVAQQRNGAPELARWPDDEPDRVHRDSKGPRQDIEGNERSVADRERESVQHKYRSEPKVDNEKVRIDAVPDMLLSDLKTPRTIDVAVNDANIKSLEWSLRAPDDRIIATKTTTPGTPNATSQPFTLDATQVGSVEGRYHLRCYGLEAGGVTRSYGVRDFNVVGTDLKTGRGSKGKSGRLTFSEYAAYPGFVKAQIDFFPADDSPACNKVMFVQAGQSLTPTGGNLLAQTSVSMDARKSGQGWSIDQQEGVRSPYYSVQKDVATDKLVDRPQQGAIGRGGPEPRAAGLRDAPDAADDRVVRFETCAMCRSESPHQIYGCATWGFISHPGGTPTLMPRTFSDGPSEEFLGAVAGWNRWFQDTQPKGKQP
ncbi:MAG TPA: DUF4157 domain-containing protein [Thermoanaerobaculia bacterium]|nr:DUF4157 domain-containing protein [Thermoanaerobaculia bacterium]